MQAFKYVAWSSSAILGLCVIYTFRLCQKTNKEQQNRQRNNEYIWTKRLKNGNSSVTEMPHFFPLSFVFVYLFVCFFLFCFVCLIFLILVYFNCSFLYFLGMVYLFVAGCSVCVWGGGGGRAPACLRSCMCVGGGWVLFFTFCFLFLKFMCLTRTARACVVYVRSQDDVTSSVSFSPLRKSFTSLKQILA